jgi:hypothetical protein
MTALDVLERIVGSLLLVETKVVLVDLFVLELLDVSPDNNTDVELDEKTENVSDDETNLSTLSEHRATRNLLKVAIVALNQGALGKHEVECECGQGDREEEADPDETRVCLDHATVPNHRANESEERDDSGDRENNTGDDDTDPSTRCDLDLGVVQEVRSRIDSVDKPEERTSGNSTGDKGQEGGDENGDPNGNTATEVSAVGHRVVVVENSLVC